MRSSIGPAVIGLVVGSFLFWSSGSAQTARDLVGAWTPISNVAEQGGVKSEPYGTHPGGVLIFDAGGRYCLTLTRQGLPKFAAKSRTKGTAEENKAVVEGSISHFGRYSVDEPGKTILFSIEGSTYPNFDGTEQKREFTLVGDVLTYSVPGFSGGGTAVASWKRAK